MGLKRIRRAVREGRYEFTVHALEEMDEDDLDELDVRKCHSTRRDQFRVDG